MPLREAATALADAVLLAQHEAVAERKWKQAESAAGDRHDWQACDEVQRQRLEYVATSVMAILAALDDDERQAIFEAYQTRFCTGCGAGLTRVVTRVGATLKCRRCEDEDYGDEHEW